MESQQSKTVSLTGYDTETIPNLTTNTNLLNIIACEFYDTIQQLYDKGFTTYLSSIKNGFDLIAAEAILKHKKEYLDIKLIVAVPCIGQESSFNNLEKTRYKAICELADKVIFTASNDHENIPYIHQQYLLTNCSQLICCYDESKIKKTYLINQIIGAKIPIINIYTVLSDYLNDTNSIKSILIQYQNLSQLTFNKNGFILKGKTPITIPFERIKTVKKKSAYLFITLKNETIIRISTVSNNCTIELPKINDNPIVSYCWRIYETIYNLHKTIKRWISTS